MAMNKNALGTQLYAYLDMDTALADGDGSQGAGSIDNGPSRTAALAGLKLFAEAVINHISGGSGESNTNYAKIDGADLVVSTSGQQII